MTLRGLLLGLLGAWFIAGFGYINDWVLGLQRLTSGRQIPVIVLGLMLVLVLVVNPVLFRLRKSWTLAPAEIGLIVILMGAACSIPGYAMMTGFTQAMILPRHWHRITPGWKEHKLLDYVPDEALVERDPSDDVLDRYIMGSQPPSDPLSTSERVRRYWGQVPWASWRRPLLTWMPLVILTALASVALALIVHRQWASHEFLSYPIADFTTSLLDREADEPFGAIFRNRLFWLGLAAIFIIRVINGLHQWFPEKMIPVRLSWHFYPFLEIWPALTKVQWARFVFRIQVIPLAIAFAFFLSSEISLTIGLTQICWIFFALPLVTMGVNLSTDYALGGWMGWQRAGSYVALGVMLAYTGRQYYRAVLARAVLFWRHYEESEDACPANVWACRVFIVSSVALVLLVMRLGAEAPFAVGTVALMFLSFVIVSRISAETGLFFIHPRWQPFAVVLGCFGGYTMDPTSLAVCGMVCTILCLDQGQVLMPYLINGLRIGEKLNIKVDRVASTTAGMYAVGVVIAAIIALCATYEFGTPTHCVWSFRWVPKKTFEAVEKETLHLKATDSLEDSVRLPWYRKLGRIHSAHNYWWAFAFGFIIVIAFSVLRLRVPWWPLHPVLFLLWMTWPMAVLSHSFLMGWFIKTMTVRFGGQPMVRKLRPLMIGLISGEILGAVTFVIVGAVYFAVTGEQPVRYWFLPV